MNGDCDEDCASADVANEIAPALSLERLVLPAKRKEWGMGERERGDQVGQDGARSEHNNRGYTGGLRPRKADAHGTERGS